MEIVSQNRNVQNQDNGAGREVAVQRAIAEVQGAMVMAKNFPRDVAAVTEEIKIQCSRLSLAEMAVYEYARGGTPISDGSIRLAESISLAWGNMISGWTPLSRTMINGVPYEEIEAFAWDLEKNRKEVVRCKVKLMRDTKKGSFPLRDERDIYEICANSAKRRERAAIFAVIPAWLKEMAIEECDKTVERTVTPETNKKLIAAFRETFGITEEQISALTQCAINAVTPRQVVRLRKIFTSIKDGIASPGDFFKGATKERVEVIAPSPASSADKIKNHLSKKQEVQAHENDRPAFDGSDEAGRENA